MTSTNREILHRLRQGELIALADETGWSIATDPLNTGAVEKLLALKAETANLLWLTVLIQHTDHVGVYAGNVPDVAFDLVEFAEDPLTVVYEQGKNLSALLGTGEVAIRRSLDPVVQHLIGGYTKGLLTLPLESILLSPAVEAVVSARFGQLPVAPRKPRIMRLGAGGQVQFLRR